VNKFTGKGDDNSDDIQLMKIELTNLSFTATFTPPSSSQKKRDNKQIIIIIDLIFILFILFFIID